MILQMRIVRCPHKDSLFLVQTHIAAVVFHDFRLNIGTGSVGGSIHVGNKTDGRKVGITGYGAIDIAVLIHECIGNAHFLHFFHQCRAELLLLVGGGTGFGELVTHGIKRYIFQKPFGYCFHRNISFILGIS